MHVRKSMYAIKSAWRFVSLLAVMREFAYAWLVNMQYRSSSSLIRIYNMHAKTIYFATSDK
jgi:hypothetical protein